MDYETILKQLQEIERQKYTYCYNSERIINNSICISLLYDEWFLKIELQKYTFPNKK